jgi:hypothetical protein
MNDNNLDIANMATGGNSLRHNVNSKETAVEGLQKATGEAPEEPQKGLAKASPKFKEVESKEQTDEERKKSVAENTVDVENNLKPFGSTPTKND